MFKKSVTIKDYERFRWFFTSNDILVIGGKSDKQNESIIERFSKPEYTIMHTSKPGSSFVIIQNKNPSKQDLKEAAIFCGCFSQQWKLNKKIIEIDIFKGKQIYKNKSMKTGTFGIHGAKKLLKIKPKLFLIIQKGILRSVPESIKEKKLIEITPGNLSKEISTKNIARTLKEKYNLLISKSEILQALPSDKINIKIIKK